MKCFYCGNEILAGERRIVPLDRPYVNLNTHKLCAEAVDNEYLKDNIQRVYDYLNVSSGKTNIKTKRK